MAKIRVFYFSSKGKMITLAKSIAKEFECMIDKIPPSFNCDDDRIVFVGVSTGKSLPYHVEMFCKGLTKARTRNVAFFVDGPKEAADKMIEYCKTAGTNPIENVLYVNGGIKFFSKAKDEDIDEILKWAREVASVALNKVSS